MEPRRGRLPLPGRGQGALAFLEWGPADRPIDLLFLHANGFNALAYRRLLTPLAHRWRILAPDQRGHGQTSLAADPAGRDHWIDLADDLLALGVALKVSGPVIAGHSMGATVALLAAAGAPTLARRLVLIDPVILPRRPQITPATPPSATPPSDSPLARSALRRRRDFPDRAAALAAFRSRGAFDGWSEEVLADYVEDGFVETAAGVRLACAPEWEASNYRAQGHHVWAALSAYPGPVEILRAGEGSTCAVDEPAGTAFPSLTVRTIAGANHFLPMRAPELVRTALDEALGAEAGRRPAAGGPE